MVWKVDTTESHQWLRPGSDGEEGDYNFQCAFYRSFINPASQLELSPDRNVWLKVGYKIFDGNNSDLADNILVKQLSTDWLNMKITDSSSHLTSSVLLISMVLATLI